MEDFPYAISYSRHLHTLSYHTKLPKFLSDNLILKLETKYSETHNEDKENPT